MKSVLKTLLIFSLMALIAAPLMADDQKKKKGRKGRAPAQITQVLKQVKAKVELTEEQSAKLEALAKEYTPKFKEVQATLAGILTPELRKARQEASKKARADGKKGKELREAVAAAVKLTDEQQEKQAAATKSQRELSGKFRSAVLALLTPEQKEKAGIKAGRKKGAKKGAAKKGAKKGAAKKGKKKDAAVPSDPESESAEATTDK